MHCEIAKCDGYVVTHAEGSTCTSCNRLQVGGNWQVQQLESEEMVDNPPLRMELAHLTDRHIIPPDSAARADRLFTLVRKKQINYLKKELMALCLLQSVFCLYNQRLSVKQLGALLDCSLQEVFFRRKHKKLCTLLPASFSIIPFNTPPYGLRILGLGTKRELALGKKCRELMLESSFEFSHGAALYCIMAENRLSSDTSLLEFISSYPHNYERTRCQAFVKKRHFNLTL